MSLYSRKGSLIISCGSVNKTDLENTDSAMSVVILSNELFCPFHNLFEYDQVKAGLTLYIEELL